MWTSVVCTLLLAVAIKWWMSRKTKEDELLDLIPGPINSDSKEKEMDPTKIHLNLHTISKKYGPIACIRFPDRKTVMLSDFKTIYKVLVTNGKAFGGRGTSFRDETMFANSGIVFNVKPDSSWKMLRKISQKHLKQFGEGMSRLQSAIIVIADGMFKEFSRKVGQNYNPYQIVCDTALNTIAFLICGRVTYAGEPIIENMKEYDRLGLQSIPQFAPWTFRLLDKFPWLKYFGFNKWSVYQRFFNLHNEIWEEVKKINKEDPDAESMCRVLTDHLLDNGGTLTEKEAQATSMVLLAAGVITTSTTFYGAINILAHHNDIQQKLHEELTRTMDRYNKITLAERNQMPYMRAFIYELLRFTSVAPFGVVHESVDTCDLNGYKIPAGTQIVTNLYSLHHDETFWENPYEFRPERFLDDDGEVLPADHPNRTHLMPFGAGTRVCLGESLALARIFIWSATLIEKFEIKPASGNDKSTTDPRKAECTATLKPQDYQVIFAERK